LADAQVPADENGAAGQPVIAANASESPSQIKASEVQVQALELIPEDRHYRELLAEAVASAYEGRGFRSLWNDDQLPPNLHRGLANALASHAFPQLMALDPENLIPRITSETVDKQDLANTVAILDAGLLIRLGIVPTAAIWEQWDRGDTPGEDGRSAEAISNDLILASSITPFEMERVMTGLGPKNWIYRELRKALPEAKQAILQYSGLPNIPDPATAGVGRPGDAYPYAPAIGAHLADRGYLDMPEEEIAALSQITPELAAALIAFQSDYGLDSDGVFGPASWRYLNTNAASRFRSVVINMHRARLLPNDFGDRYLFVNLPSAELFAFEDNDFLASSMRIVHGQASKDTHRTPSFRDVMQEIVFGPYWNVPKSIAVKEILPKAQGDWGYLSRNRYEIVEHFNPYNKNSHRLSPQNLELVSQGRLFLRQKPGPTNSLGRVKFLFPNTNNIYMHDTPAKAFFARANRDYSHGCIRVAQPEELGKWVLSAQGWSGEQVKEAMFADSWKSQPIEKDVNVFITYFTTFPRPVIGGKIVLAPARDVYDLDPKDSRTLSSVLPWEEPPATTIPSGGQ
tara:strand:+ start:1236 stop:2951 length:1716 start_codon:yes stop_codon:yes gene_type:complete